MTSRFRNGTQDPGLTVSTSIEEDADKFYIRHVTSINQKGAEGPVQVVSQDQEPLLPQLRPEQPLNSHPQRRQLFRRRLPSDDDDGGSKKKRSFCRAWCDMWFLMSQSRAGCIILNGTLFVGGILIILLTVFGGIMDCPELQGGVVYLFLVASLSLTLGCLCCCYHWVKDNDDLPYGIFCVAYYLMFLFMCVTITGTIVVFTRVHPVGPDQPPPDMVNGTTVDVLSKCKMVELPFGILIVSYFVAVLLLIIAYFGWLVAFGAWHIDD